jgi:hypothetical protein
MTNVKVDVIMMFEKNLLLGLKTPVTRHKIAQNSRCHSSPK